MVDRCPAVPRQPACAPAANQLAHLTPPLPAVNQALLCTALGLPPAFFRRFSQSNASFTVLDFEGESSSGSGKGTVAPRVRCERMNQASAVVIVALFAWLDATTAHRVVSCCNSGGPPACAGLPRWPHSSLSCKSFRQPCPSPFAASLTCNAVPGPAAQPLQAGQVAAQPAGAHRRHHRLAGSAGALTAAAGCCLLGTGGHC